MSKESGESERKGKGSDSRIAPKKNHLERELASEEQMTRTAAAPWDHHIMDFKSFIQDRKQKQEQLRRFFDHPYLDMLRIIFECQLYDGFIATIVIFNLVTIIIETDCQALGLPAPAWVLITNSVILVFFVLEVCVKIAVYQTRFVHSFWNMLDFTIVGMDVVVMVLNVLGFGKMSIFRIVRLVRLSRSVKVLNMFPELALMLSALRGALVSLLWGLVLLMLALLIFAIMAVQILHPINQRVAERGVYEGCARCPRAFESVWMAALTTFQTMVAGDSWGEVALPISEESPVVWTFFVFVLVMLQLLLMNVILAAVLDAATGARQENFEIIAKEKEQEMHKFHKKLVQLSRELDDDGDGTLSYKEIVDGFTNNEEFLDIMESMDIMPDDLGAVWGVLDRDHSGKVDYEHFATELFKMKSEDSHTMMVFVKNKVDEIRDMVQTEMMKLDSHTNMLNVLTENKESMVDKSQEITGKNQELVDQLHDITSQKVELVHQLKEIVAGGVKKQVHTEGAPYNSPESDESPGKTIYPCRNHVVEEQTAQLPVSMNSPLSSELSALKADISRDFCEKFKALQDTIESLIEDVHYPGAAVGNGLAQRAVAAHLQVASDLEVRPTRGRPFRMIPPYCCSGTSGVAPPSSILTMDPHIDVGYSSQTN